MREIWFIEVRLHKSHAITGLSLGQIVWALLVAIGPVGFIFIFYFSLTLSLVAGLF